MTKKVVTKINCLQSGGDRQFHKEKFEKVWSIANENCEKSSLVGSINTHKKKNVFFLKIVPDFSKKLKNVGKSG